MSLHITEFEGGNALSEFRAQQLLPRLQAISDKVAGVSARFVHLVAADHAPDPAERERLAALLTYGDPYQGPTDGPLLVVTPRLGVYATRSRLPDGRIIDGVANLGRNPTTGEVPTRLEVWLFDFDEDLYGQVLETSLVAYLRPEEKFDSLEALTAQVMADAQRAKAVLRG